VSQTFLRSCVTTFLLARNKPVQGNFESETSFLAPREHRGCCEAVAQPGDPVGAPASCGWMEGVHGEVRPELRCRLRTRRRLQLDLNAPVK